MTVQPSSFDTRVPPGLPVLEVPFVAPTAPGVMNGYMPGFQARGVHGGGAAGVGDQAAAARAFNSCIKEAIGPFFLSSRSSA